MREKEFTGSLTDIDYQKGLTSQLINIIDERIDELISLEEGEEIGEETWEEIFEYIEHIVGLGFVVLQQYMTVAYGNLQKKKKDVLSKGPKHKNGNTFSEVVNASANYWKHNSEWPLDKNYNYITDVTQFSRVSDKQDRELLRIVSYIKKIEAIFNKMIHPVSVNDDYPLGNILFELSHTENRRFSAVFKKILEWRNELNR